MNEFEAWEYYIKTTRFFTRIQPIIDVRPMCDLLPLMMKCFLAGFDCVGKPHEGNNLDSDFEKWFKQANIKIYHRHGFPMLKLHMKAAKDAIKAVYGDGFEVGVGLDPDTHYDIDKELPKITPISDEDIPF